MISENIQLNSALYIAMRHFEQNGTLPTPCPAGITVHRQGVIKLDYGYSGNTIGSVYIKQGNYLLTEVECPGTGPTPVDYNYPNDLSALAKYQNYITALSSPDLTKNKNAVPAIILMTSECCRSLLVEAAFSALFTNNQDFTASAFGGIDCAIHIYNHTLMAAGKNPSQPLVTQDYLQYITSNLFTGDVNNTKASINALAEYISTSGIKVP